MGRSTGLGAATLGVREGDLAGPDHAQALAGELLQVVGVPDALELSLELGPLSLEARDPLLELANLVALRQEVPDRAGCPDPEHEQHHNEHHRPDRDPSAGRDLGPGAQRENLR